MSEDKDKPEQTTTEQATGDARPEEQAPSEPPKVMIWGQGTWGDGRVWGK